MTKISHYFTFHSSFSLDGCGEEERGEKGERASEREERREMGEREGMKGRWEGDGMKGRREKELNGAISHLSMGTALGGRNPASKMREDTMRSSWNARNNTGIT